jgi:hypothetical protein
MKAPFSEGDRVSVIRHGKLGDYPALVLDSKRDAFGWDVLVSPEDGNATRWVGSDQLIMLRKGGDR